MCDLGPLFNALLIAGGLIVASAAAIGVAAVLNAGFFSAPGAPIPMAAAAALAASASILLVTAENRAIEFFTCIGSPEACQGDLTNLTEALQGIAGVLGVQALAAAAVAAVAWIPWAAQPAMYVIATSLLAQIPLIALVTTYANDFQKCVKAIGGRQIPQPLIVVTIVVLVIALPLVHTFRGRRAAS